MWYRWKKLANTFQDSRAKNGRRSNVDETAEGRVGVDVAKKAYKWSVIHRSKASR